MESSVEDPVTKVIVPRDPKLMWEDMYEQFLDKTLESGYKYKLKAEFANLTQVSRSISRYSMEYQALGTRLQHMGLLESSGEDIMNKWISGLKDLSVKRKIVEKQPSSFYAAVQIALGMEAINDKLQYIESFVAKDKIEKKKFFL